MAAEHSVSKGLQQYVEARHLPLEKDDPHYRVQKMAARYTAGILWCPEGSCMFRQLAKSRMVPSTQPEERGVLGT